MRSSAHSTDRLNGFKPSIDIQPHVRRADDSVVDRTRFNAPLAASRRDGTDYCDSSCAPGAGSGDSGQRPQFAAIQTIKARDAQEDAQLVVRSGEPPRIASNKHDLRHPLGPAITTLRARLGYSSCVIALKFRTLRLLICTPTW